MLAPTLQGDVGSKVTWVFYPDRVMLFQENASQKVERLLYS
jgi:hypothetical protein